MELLLNERHEGDGGLFPSQSVADAPTVSCRPELPCECFVFTVRERSIWPQFNVVNRAKVFFFFFIIVWLNFL